MCINIYRSSSFTTFYKFTIILILIGITALCLGSLIGVFNFKISELFLFLWVFLCLVQIPFRIKSVKVSKEGLKILSANTEDIIAFKYIQSVSIFDLSNPSWMITVKYFDSVNNQNKVISYVPSSKAELSLNGDDMARFIINESKIHNPQFKESNSFKNVLILLLIGLPLILGSIYC